MLLSGGPVAAQQHETARRNLGDFVRAHTPQDEVLRHAGRTGGQSIVVLAEPIHFPPWSDSERKAAEQFYLDTSPLRQAAMLQRMLPLQPQMSVRASIASSVPGPSLSQRVFQDSGIRRSPLGRTSVQPVSFSIDRVLGEEAAPLVTTDLGNLIRKSKNALSTDVQARTPIVNDPRVRSSRIGSLAASGSYWVPARADLDTAVSKIDSRLIDDVVVIPGPFSSLYGPGFQFVDFQLLGSPRYESGNEVHGRSSFDHQSNGNQNFGQQSLIAGGQDWGLRGTYSHRLGSNYRAGDGTSVAADYESRAFSIAYGRDWSDQRSIEFSLLRLDQTDLEFPGFVFDISALTTDGYQLAFYADDAWIGDRKETEIWYNRTEFSGDSRNLDKTRQFPVLARLNFDATTDADVMSTGYRRALVWGGDAASYQFTLGHDLRMIKQEVNEDFTLIVPPTPVSGTSPLPRSFSVNPGLFAAYEETWCECLTFELGGRIDFVQTDVTENVLGLSDVGVTPPNLDISYIQSIGTDVTQTDRWMGSLFGKMERKFTEAMTGSASLGFAQRAPTLTELYGVQQLLLVVQNGLNVTTGDPRLKSEKLLQLDLALDVEREDWRGGVRGFCGWAFDYLTFENTGVRVGLNNTVDQTSLRYVNTSLATLVGFESYVEWMTQSRAAPFATLRFVDGRDRTRNGDFATRPADAAAQTPSMRVSGLPRGAFAGPRFTSNADSEPLPGISPMEGRIGVRLKDSVARPQWIVEIAARIVDNQDRVAESLLELPTPGFTTWDVRTVWQPQRWDFMTAYAGFENFTDKTYREHLDFQSRSGVNVFQPGINFYCGADVQY